jgi:hypothetical protein
MSDHEQLGFFEGDQMREAAEAFHTANPKLWDLFVRFCWATIQAGHQHYSVNAIFERIRWETDVGEQGAPGQAFKINNNHRAFYARRFMRVFPEHDGFFRTREQRPMAEEPATGGELGPGEFPEERRDVA